ncbi:pyridoxal-dependent decarboxylase [Zopfochytrium polystomum]|nr:pyridoxal-dependent decarboxylase [Zopfochytrium polystomum]
MKDFILEATNETDLVAFPKRAKLSGGINATKGKAVKQRQFGQPLPIAVDHDSRSVREILGSRVADPDGNGLDDEDAFYVADLSEIIRQHNQWKAMLPRVEPFYAVKCNPDPVVVKTLVGLGIGFDCASRGEIQQVLDFGVDPSKVIYANPCKQASHLRYAGSRGVTMITFDNADELHKVKQVMPNAQLILRVLTDDSKSLCKLGLKFGASLDVVPTLLRTAQELSLNVIGVSFHVGSGCFDANAFGDAVKRASFVLSEGRKYGFEMSMVDVGGGFPCNNAPGLTFKEIVDVLAPAIEEHIPSHIRVIAEPGRYYVASAFTLAVNVVARRVVARDAPASPSMDESAIGSSITKGVEMQSADEHPAFMYYVNDGIYGSFNCIPFDHATVVPRILKRNGAFSFKSDHGFIDSAEYACSIWGPTCDSIDCITREGSLPELNVGDWLYFENMGAYTMCAASQFNGFRKPSITYTLPRST